MLSFDTINICIVCGNPSVDGLTHNQCRTKFSAEGNFTGVVFNPIAKKLIYKFKNKPYLTGLASFMTNLMYEKLIQDEQFVNILKQKPILVPIPITRNTEKKRGYNQSKTLAKHLAKKFDLELLDSLIRIKETKPQTGLSKKERRENVANAFFLNPSSIIPKTILLVDDVLSSGATMNEAAKVLKSGGTTEIWALAFAKED
jgi:ComF family protein